MFLSKRNGIYYLWYTNDSGRTQKVSTHTSNKPAAIQFLRDFHPKGNSSRTTLSALLNELIKARSGDFAKGTLGIYHKSFRHLQRLFGDIRIRLLSPYHFELHKAERLKVVSATIVNIVLRALKAAMGVATK